MACLGNKIAGTKKVSQVQMRSCLDGVSGPEGVSETPTPSGHPAGVAESLSCPPGLGVSEIRKWHGSGLSSCIPPSPHSVLGR